MLNVPSRSISIDGLESIGGHAEHGRGKIAGRAAHHDVDFAELIARGLEGRGHAVIIANIGRVARRRASAFTNRGDRGVQLFLLASHQHDLGAMLGEALRHALPDAAASASDESGFPVQKTIPENGHLQSILCFQRVN